MELISIEEHNTRKRVMAEHKQKTGVECPKCGEPLTYIGSTVLTSYPPQRPVECIECGWEGRIVV